MADFRALAMHGKERLLRIVAANHTYNEPTWLQFGEAKSVHLYLSQRASVAEESWLKISSYIINLLIGSINQQLNVLTCGRYKLEQVNCNVGVVTLGNPSACGIGAHSDGKNGQMCANTPGYGRFQMNVVTLGVQNHCGATSRRSWWLKNDLQKTTSAHFEHDFFIIHCQTMGVQESILHDVNFWLWMYLSYHMLSHSPCWCSPHVSTHRHLPPSGDQLIQNST
jgi:hypothetical protein